jgi:hypothetical protein
MLPKEEVHKLQESILYKYNTLTGKVINTKVLNSNPDNYKDLCENINDLIPDGSVHPASLAKIFHFSKINPSDVKQFRSKFINALYYYCYGQGRNEFLINPTVKTSSGNMSGCWELYYDALGDFRSRLIKNIEAELKRMLIFIHEDGNTISYRHKDDSGTGTIRIYGSNFHIILKSSVSGDMGTIMLNTGSKMIEHYTDHIKMAGGVFNHVTKTGYLKIGKCAMVYCPMKNESDLDNMDNMQPVKINRDDTDTKQKLRNFFSKSYNVGHVSEHGASGTGYIEATAGDFLH